ALRPAFAGVDAGNWVDPSGETRYVRVRLPAESRENAADLARIPLALQAPAAPGAGPSGPAVVPLGQVATIAPSTGPAQIDHYQRQRVITIGANIEGALGEVTRGVQQRLRDLRLPPGYQTVPGGQVKSQGEVFGAFGIAMLIAVL